MYEGYLEFGGTEIINSARAVGYMETSHCSVSWLRCPPCDGVDDAVNGGQPFIIENISQAPWYDYRAPASARFLGVHGLDIDGLPGSTREAEVAEGIMDGGVVGKPRHATRRMRVRAVLSAQGEDALEYGLSWLESALTPGRCSLHGDACGSADARLFTACPPTRESIVKPLVVWNEAVTNLANNPSFETAGAVTAIRRNLATNPSFEAATAATVEVRRNRATDPRATAAATGAGAVGWTTSRWFGAPPAAGTHSFITDGVGPVPGITTYVRKTWTVAPGGNGDTGFNHNGGGTSGIPVLPGEVWTGSSYLRSSVGSKVAQAWFQFYDAAGATLGGRVSAPTVTLSAGVWTRLSHTVTVPANAAFMTFYSDITGGGTPWAAGEMLDGTALLIEKSVLGTYFDGALAPSGDFVYSWTGTANASASVQYGTQVPGTYFHSGMASIQSSEWASSGAKSLRQIPNSPATAVTYTTISAASLGMVAGKTYTVMAKSRLIAAQTGTLEPGGRTRQIMIRQGTGGTDLFSTKAPNAAGVTEHRLSGVIMDVATASVFLWNGASAGGGDVWWDDLLIVEGTYAGPYFDGSTPAKVRRNLAPRPQATASYANGYGTGGAGSVSLASDARFPGGQARQMQWTTSPTGASGLYIGPGTGNPATPGATYLFRVLAEMWPGGEGSLYLPGFTKIGSDVRVARPDGTTEIYAFATANPTTTSATGFSLSVNYGSGAPGATLPAPGQTMRTGGWLVEQRSDFAPYFDGATPPSGASVDSAWEGAVNGSASYLYDGDFTYAWTGTADASTSEQRYTSVLDASAGSSGIVAAQSSHWAENREHSVRLIAITSTGDRYRLVPLGSRLESGLLATVMFTTRTTAEATLSNNVILQEEGGASRSLTLISGGTKLNGVQSWRVTVNIPSDWVANKRVVLRGSTVPGVDIWYDSLLVMQGEHQGDYFDGASPDSPPEDLARVGASVDEYEWTGAVDASTSTHRTGQVTAAPDPIAYQEIMFRLMRNLHTVTCVSGPTVEEKLHRGDAWGYIVEFVLVAAVPFLFSETKPVTLEPSTPVVIQDVPFNLVPYPSAELALGTVVATTNLVLNPSVEVNTNGWSKQGTVAADTVLSKSTELAVAGPNSAKVLFTATSAGSNGWMGVEQPVTLTGITPNMRYSVNLWSVASVQSGAAVLGNLEYHVYWQDAASATLRDDVIATLPASGGAASKKSILPPAGTTKALVRPVLRLTSWAAGDVVRLYADAAAVTVP